MSSTLNLIRLVEEHWIVRLFYMSFIIHSMEAFVDYSRGMDDKAEFNCCRYFSYLSACDTMALRGFLISWLTVEFIIDMYSLSTFRYWLWILIDTS